MMGGHGGATVAEYRFDRAWNVKNELVTAGSWNEKGSLGMRTRVC